MKILFNELKNYKISLLLILVATYISTTFELMLPLLLANILNIGIIENYGLNYIKNIILVMAFFIIISILLNILINFLINKISIYSATNIKNNIFEKTLTLKNKEISNLTTSSLITRTNQDIDQIKNFISSFLSIIFKAPILFVSCITIIKTLNKNFSIILIATIIILITYLIIIITKLLPLSKKIQTTTDKLNKLTKEKITGIKLIKSYNKLQYQDKKIEDANNEYLNTTKKVIKISALTYPILNLIINSITIIILILSINLVKTNSLQTGTIVATIQYILQILLSIIMLSTIIILIPNTKISLNRINEVLNSNSYTEKENNINLENNKIKFENVSYIIQNNKILNNINLEINKFEKIGIIGPTGCGKTTLFKLLLKENNTTEGNITIDDYNINDLTRKNIISKITYLPQISTILTGTILENIAFSNPKLTTEELQKIIYTCNLLELINKTPQNINYKLEENGSNISGGQKQRICLARALAKNDNLLILDEPFSSLDYKTEKEIITKLNTFYQNKTLIIISQKISTIKDLNKIIVMDKGKIIDIDTHENLLKNCKLYKEMYDYQKEVLEYDI